MDWYEQLIRSFKKEELKLIAPPTDAFKFFIAYNAGKIANYGFKLRMENWIIGIIDIIAHISLILGILLSIFVLKWYSAISIPVMFIIGTTVFGVRSFTTTFIFSVTTIIMSIILFLFLNINNKATMIFLTLLPLPSILRFINYILATIFLRYYLLRNKENYDCYIRYKSGARGGV